MADWDKAIDLGNYGQSNRNWGGMHVNPAVFLPTAFISFAVILFSLIAPKASTDLFAALRSGAVYHFDWFFMTSGNLLLLFCVVVALSPLGKIRLGGKGAKPDYSRLSWFAMLFGAGMGIGLVFYGVGEPVTHFTSAMAGAIGRCRWRRRRRTQHRDGGDNIRLGAAPLGNLHRDRSCACGVHL